MWKCSISLTTDARLILGAQSIELGFEGLRLSVYVKNGGYLLLYLHLRQHRRDIVIIIDKLIFSIVGIKLNIQKLRNGISKIL
jgi:hypothetical protein